MNLKFKREDGNIISTVSPWCMAWYGNYETAIIKPDGEVRIQRKKRLKDTRNIAI